MNIMGKAAAQMSVEINSVIVPALGGRASVVDTGFEPARKKRKNWSDACYISALRGYNSIGWFNTMRLMRIYHCNIVGS